MSDLGEYERYREDIETLRGGRQLGEWAVCERCARRCHPNPDGLCWRCRAAAKQHAGRRSAECRQCGARCVESPDGLCGECRKRTPEGRKRHREAYLRWKRNRKEHE